MANILIAEDDEVLRDVYNKKFALAGYDIRTAENGKLAIAAIVEKEPDIMILDLHMPEVSGFDVLKEYPREKRDFPIIILSNFGDAKTKNLGKELGADDFFVKQEMTIKTLLEMVENLLKARKYWTDDEDEKSEEGEKPKEAA